MSHSHGSPAHLPAHPTHGNHHGSVPHDHVHLSHHEELMARLRREHDLKIKATIRNGLLSIGGFVVLAGGGVWFWLHEMQRQHAEEQAVATAQGELRAELLVSELTPDLARRVLARIDATRSQWQGGPDAGAIQRQADAARAALAEAAAADRLASELSTLQHALDGATPTLADWQQLHDRASRLEGVPGSPARAQLDAVFDRVDAGWADALLAAATGSEPATALGHLTTAIDLGTCHLAATKGDAAREQAWRQRLQTLTPRFDAAQAAVFDDAAIAAVPCEALLPGTVETDWIASSGSSLSKHLVDDRLEVTNAAGAHSQVLVLRRGTWYAAQLAFSLQLDRGDVVVFGRAAQQFDPRHGSGLALGTAARDGVVALAAGRRVAIELTIVGDRLQATVDGQRLEQRIRHDERRGGFGLLVRPDSAFTLSDLRVRRLGGNSAHSHPPHRH